MDEDEQGRRSTWRAALAVPVVVVVLAVAGLAVLGGQVSRVLSTVGAPIGDPIGQGPGQQDGPGAGPGAGDPDPGAEPGPDDPDAIQAFQDASRPDLLIIREGRIDLQVVELDAALAEAGVAIVALGGYESGSQRTGKGDEARAEVTYRFPSASWEAALVAIRAVGEEVLAEQSQTTDVTGEVVDIDARVRNLRVAEAALQSIMDRATEIGDVLDVQARLTAVRGEIEQLTAKADQLRDQAAMSTLTVTFVLRPTPVVARQEARFDPGREAEAATARLVGMLQAVASAGIWFGIVWVPILLALGFVGLVALAIGRRVSRRVAGPETPLPSAGGGA